MTDDVELRERVALAMLVFALAAPVAYMAQRIFEIIQSGVSVPAMSSEYTAFYWRAVTATWWGGLLAAAAAAVIGRWPPERRRSAATYLGNAAVPVLVVLALLARRLP